MKQLTHKNYYSKDNNYISSSKMKVFIKDKSLYRRRYIDWEPQEMTDALIIGSAVDAILTGGQKELEKRFTIVSRRSTKEDNDDKRIQINPTMAEKIMGISGSVMRQDIWKDLKQKKWQKQVILKDDKLKICGMLDFLLVDKVNNKAIIVDLKTSNTIEPKKYYWHAMDYGYPLQMAFYKRLVKSSYPDIKQVECYHLVVEKDSDELYDCALFQFEDEMLDYYDEVITRTLKEMSEEKDYLPKNIGWKDKVHLIN